MFVISRGGAIPWPACSPDFSVSDYFTWGYLKSKVYLMKPSDVAELKYAIKEEITAIPDNMVSNERMEQCRLDGGKQLCSSRIKYVIVVMYCTKMAFFFLFSI
jgi:hypothetical protein